LQAILGLPTADDDAEKAMARGKKESPKPPETDITELINAAYETYTTMVKDDIADGFYINPKKFKDAVREQFKKLTPAKRKKFEWTSESVAGLVKNIKSADVFSEIGK